MIRSLTWTRCGEVYIAARRPIFVRMECKKAAVEPLPLVPAMWMVGGSLRWGSPMALRRGHNLLSERSIDFG